MNNTTLRLKDLYNAPWETTEEVMDYIAMMIKINHWRAHADEKQRLTKSDKYYYLKAYEWQI